MKPNVKEIIRYTSLHKRAVILLSLVMLFSVGIGFAIYSTFEKTVVINDNGKAICIKTTKYTVKEALDQKGIGLGPFDELSVELNSILQKKIVNDVYIKRAVEFTVRANGQDQTLYSSKPTVYDALQSSCKSFSMYDRVEGAELTDRLKPGLKLSVVKVSDKIVKQTDNVAFTTIRRESKELASGEEKVIRNGSEGVNEKTFRVILENGKEIARQLISECVIKPIENCVIGYGPQNSHRTSRGAVIRYRKILSMRTTAYTASYADTGKSPGDFGFGITYTGKQVRKGIVAVDPRIIPLGSRLYVEIAGDTPDYGYAVAEDTGGAIKGDLMDLYFDSRMAVSDWGCRRAKVYVLDN